LHWFYFNVKLVVCFMQVGKFVPNIIAKVSENLDEECKNTLTTYQDLVVSLMGTKDPDEKGTIQKQLEMSLRAVKDVALNSKKQAPA